jgi:hypothetical protein
MKLKTCKVCKNKFAPIKPLQFLCTENDFKCAAEYAQNKRDSNMAKQIKADKKAVKARLNELEPLKYWEDKAQNAMNKWVVRVRDRDLPCISCGTTNPNVQYCASHYRTRKAANQLRYNLDNLHKACNHYCNKQLSGNIENYRPSLIAKIGQERHDALINNHETKRWTKEECQEIERFYKEKLKLLGQNHIPQYNY